MLLVGRRCAHHADPYPLDSEADSVALTDQEKRQRARQRARRWRRLARKVGKDGKMSMKDVKALEEKGLNKKQIRKVAKRVNKADGMKVGKGAAEHVGVKHIPGRSGQTASEPSNPSSPGPASPQPTNQPANQPANPQPASPQGAGESAPPPPSYGTQEEGSWLGRELDAIATFRPDFSPRVLGKYRPKNFGLGARDASAEGQRFTNEYLDKLEENRGRDTFDLQGYLDKRDRERQEWLDPVEYRRTGALGNVAPPYDYTMTLNDR